MADALALGASGVTHGGSSPLPRTQFTPKQPSLREGCFGVKYPYFKPHLIIDFIIKV